MRTKRGIRRRACGRDLGSSAQQYEPITFGGIDDLGPDDFPILGENEG